MINKGAERKGERKGGKEREGGREGEREYCKERKQYATADMEANFAPFSSLARVAVMHIGQVPMQKYRLQIRR